MSGKTILLVDDDQDLLVALATMLRRRGVEVVVATDAAAAIRVALREVPDVAFLDIGLPGGEGIAVLERMRSLPRLAAMPVVIMSGRDPAKYRDAALAAGALAYLTKPIDEEDLFAALAIALPDVKLDEKKASGPAGVDLAGKLILVVDDDEEFLVAISAMLRRYGLRVVVSGDAVSATATAVREKPDIILLDIGLPGGDGTLVMKRVRALPQLAAVPIVILSGRDPAQYREAALEGGAAAYLSKPADEETLVAALRLALSGH